MPEFNDANVTTVTPEVTTPITSVTPEATPWTMTNGEFGDGTPDNIKGLLEKKKWTNISQMADGYIGLEKLKGSGEHLVIPESKEDVDGWNKVWAAVGKPESADKYEFTNESGVDVSDELITGFKDFAHGLNFTQDQLAGAIKFQLDAVKAGDEMYAAQQEEKKTGNIDAMKQKWQTDYEPTVTKIDAAAEKLGVKAYFESLGIDKEPQIVNMLLTIANSDSEDTLEVTGGSVPAPATLQGQLQEVMASEAYKERFHPQHKAVMAKYMQLNMDIANTGQGRAPQ